MAQQNNPVLEKTLREQQDEALKLLDGALTMAEEAAQWAGQQRGADRDDAVQTAMRIVARLEDVPRAQYRGRLADLLFGRPLTTKPSGYCSHSKPRRSRFTTSASMRSLSLVRSSAALCSSNSPEAKAESTASIGTSSITPATTPWSLMRSGARPEQLRTTMSPTGSPPSERTFSMPRPAPAS